jgi:Tol biopolymer transport system component
MSLVAGTRLGPYEILGPIGAGGMGEVYKARDTRLDRIVAIKILPPEWANDPAMKERFDHEAKTVASLNHPNICVLHDIGSESTVSFLVMEYMEGETLADALSRGPLTLDEALAAAIAIADALDKAHRKGVIHRDLKPANVMLTASGPKLLDFGLAKSQAALPAASNLTIPGMILGTLQYMAPEQFDGVEADRRSDIFAFGVLMHEMITGKKAFEGKSQVLLISAIATSTPPPVSRVQLAAPPALDHVIKTCLEKDPADRWQDARDLLAELQWIADGGEEAGFSVTSAAGHPRRRWLRRAALAAAAALLAVLAVPAWLYSKGPADPEEVRFRVPRNLSAEPGEAQQGNPGNATGVFSPFDSAISPDGRFIVFRARQVAGDPWFLYVRPVGAVAPRKIDGTEDAFQPFWSADSQSVAFVTRGKLRRVRASGGAPEDVCNAPDFYGGAWNREGRIIFGSASGLFMVAADGGTPKPLTTLGEGESGHFWPRFLPDGRHYMYLANSGQAANRAIYAGSLDSPPESKDRTMILAAGSNAGYSASPGGAGTGHLLFHREGAVFAQPFDPKTLAVSGEETRVASDVMATANGLAAFDASESGPFIYFVSTLGGGSGGQEAWTWRLQWVDRAATEIETVGPFGVYRGMEVSPDGTRVAVHRHDGTGGDVWVMERPPRAPTRITFDAKNDNSSPIWSPSGAKIVFASFRNGKWGLYLTRSDGSGAEEQLLESELRTAPLSWSPDGKHLVYWVQDPKTAGDLWVLPMDGEKKGDKKPEAFLATPADETHAQVSPDSRWIAYTSNLTGRREVWVRPFPAGLGQWQISPDASTFGGDWPRWNRSTPGTTELFYHSNTTSFTGGIYAQPEGFQGPIFSVALKASTDSLEVASPLEVIRAMAIRLSHGSDYHTYDVSPDTKRFLVMQRVNTGDASTGAILTELPVPGLTVAMNWTSGLKKK